MKDIDLMISNLGLIRYSDFGWATYQHNYTVLMLIWVFCETLGHVIPLIHIKLPMVGPPKE